MEAIPAANHVHIEFEVDAWRLISTELDSPTTLVEATPEGLVAHPVFRAARSLPSASISPIQVTRIMLGWAPESQAWRLGMLLSDGAQSTLDTTQMQWCELAEWPQVMYPYQLDNAKIAGQALARLINRPFQIVEPNGATRVPVFSTAVEQSTPIELEPNDDETIPDTTTGKVESEPTPQFIPEIESIPLPIRFSGWRLTRTASGLRFRRVKSWWTVTLVRLTVIFTLCVLFLILSIGSRERGLATVEPEQLPDIGLVIGGILLIFLLATIWDIFTEKSVIIDTFQREVYSQGLILPFVQWRIPFDRIQYVLLTQSPVKAQGRRKHSDPMQISQEVWLHVFDGTNFHEIADLGSVEGQSWMWDIIRTHHHTHVRRHIQLSHYDTSGHHAGQQIAQLIGVPIYMDFVH